MKIFGIVKFCIVSFFICYILSGLLLIVLLDFIPWIRIQEKSVYPLYWAAVEKKMEEYDNIKTATVVSTGDDVFNTLDTTVVIQLIDGTSLLLGNVNLYNLASEKIEVIAINDRRIYGSIRNRNENQIVSVTGLGEIKKLKEFIPDTQKGLLYILANYHKMYSFFDDIYHNEKEIIAYTSSKIIDLKVQLFDMEINFYDENCKFVRTVYNDGGVLKVVIKESEFSK